MTCYLEQVISSGYLEQLRRPTGAQKFGFGSGSLIVEGWLKLQAMCSGAGFSAIVCAAACGKLILGNLSGVIPPCNSWLCSQNMFSSLLLSALWEPGGVSLMLPSCSCLYGGSKLA